MYERITSQNQPLPKDRCDDNTFILLGRVSKCINSLKNNKGKRNRVNSLVKRQVAHSEVFNQKNFGAISKYLF